MWGYYTIFLKKLQIKRRLLTFYTGSDGAPSLLQVLSVCFKLITVFKLFTVIVDDGTDVTLSSNVIFTLIERILPVDVPFVHVYGGVSFDIALLSTSPV